MIDEKAEVYIKQNYDCYCPDTPRSFETDIERAYIAGAKENGVVWHDLHKDPHDLPFHSHFCLNERGDHVHWNKDYQKWQNKQGMFTDVIAWCEVPKFEEV